MWFVSTMKYKPHFAGPYCSLEITFNCANYRSVSITTNECWNENGGGNENNIYTNWTQPAITCSNRIIETLEKDMKYKDTRAMSIMPWWCLCCWLWKILFFICTLFWLKNFILYLHFILVFLLLNLNKNIAGLGEFFGFFSHEWEYYVIKMVDLVS